MRLPVTAACSLLALRAWSSTCSPVPARAPHPGVAVAGTVVADFDRDGRDDLVVVSDCSDIGPCSFASHHRPDGAGGLVADAWREAVIGLPAPTAADLDGVNGPDLVVTTFSGGTVDVFPSLGDGSFGPRTSWPAGGTRAYAAAVGDLDGDGLADIAVTDDSALTVNVLLNLGGAAFAPAVAYPVGRGPASVVIEDFDGDGRADVAVANLLSHDLSILSGIGRGELAAEWRRPIPRTPWEIWSDDFDGDGRPDLASVGYESRDASILLNDGAGGFPTTQVVPVGQEPISLRSADLDGDGAPDLAISNRGTGDASVLLNDGSGRFGGETRVSALVGTNRLVASLAILELDGSDGPDLVLPGWWELGLVPNLGGGIFTRAELHEEPSDGRDVEIADLDGDTLPDVVTCLFYTELLAMRRNEGTGLAATSIGLPVGWSPVEVEAGDLDGDTLVDLVTANEGSNDVSIVRNLGGWTFAPEIRVPAGTLPRAVQLADVDGSGRLDILVANGGSFDVTVLLEDGAGGYAATATPQAPQWLDLLAVADLDGRLGPDLVAGSYNQGSVRVALNDGAGRFGAWTMHDAGSNVMSIATGDLDRDGWTDVILGNLYSIEGVTILLNDGAGAGGLLPAMTIDLPGDEGGWGVDVGDVDGRDGPDIAVGRGQQGHVDVLFNRGDGTFGAPASTWIGSSPVVARLADLDGSGGMDVVTYDQSGQTLGVVRDCIGPPWLLRNDEVRTLVPLAPALRSIFTGPGGRRLDLAGPDGVPTAGTGDDDDAHVEGIASGWVDVDAGIGDPGRPLVFYQVEGDGIVLHLSRSGATGIRIELE